MKPNEGEEDFCSTCALDVEEGEGVQFGTFHGLGFPIVLCTGCVGDAAKVVKALSKVRR